jgi:adenylylsulfate kinase
VEQGIAYLEVHTDAPLEVLVARDVKGLYRRAIAGEIPNFTGISDPYERPESPDLTVRSDQETLPQSVERVLSELRARGLVRPPPTARAQERA